MSCYLTHCSGGGRANLCVDAERLTATLDLAKVGEAIAHEEQHGIEEQGVVVGVSFVFVEFLWLGGRVRAAGVAMTKSMKASFHSARGAYHDYVKKSSAQSGEVPPVREVSLHREN